MAKFAPYEFQSRCRFTGSLEKTLSIVGFLITLTSSTAFSQSVHVGTCGPRPIASCSGPATCVNSPIYGGTWKLGQPLAKGTRCTTNNVPSGPPGMCNGSGLCEPLPGGSSGIMIPKYYLLAILYAPPGNASSVSYGNGSTFGATTSTSNMLGTGLTVGVTGNFTLTNNYQVSSTSGSTFQINKTTTNSITAFSTADSVDHSKDLFYIWVHPQVNYSQAYEGAPVDISFAASSIQSLDVVTLDANQLMGKEAIASDQKASLLDLTPEDLVKIASQDPFSNPSYKLDPQRFHYMDQVQYAGPPAAGELATSTPYSISDSSTGCKTESGTVADTVTIGGSGGFNFFGAGENVVVVGTVTWNRTQSTGNCSGTIQTFTFTPHTTTIGERRVVDVYEDSVFHTFMFVDDTPKIINPATIPALTGTLKNGEGKPLQNQLVAITFPNGISRKLYTDANGDFSIFNASTGSLIIKSGTSSQKVLVLKGQTSLPTLSMKP